VFTFWKAVQVRSDEALVWLMGHVHNQQIKCQPFHGCSVTSTPHTALITTKTSGAYLRPIFFRTVALTLTPVCVLQFGSQDHRHSLHAYSLRSSAPPTSHEPNWVVHEKTTPGQALVYCLSGDYNRYALSSPPLFFAHATHSDPRIGVSAGLAREAPAHPPPQNTRCSH
jgi:hypothetical protein